VIAIIGSGTVGRTVGKCFSRYGFDVVFYDTNGNVLKDLERDIKRYRVLTYEKDGSA